MQEDVGAIPQHMYKEEREFSTIPVKCFCRKCCISPR